MSSPPVLTVTQLTDLLKEHLEPAFAEVWVVGEISNCTYASSGHIYFTLKDDAAQLKTVLWRSAAQRLRFRLRDGLEVVASGAIELYQGRGQIQMVAQRVIPQGVGPLELAFRQLYEKLAAEGLFDPARKRPIPRFPRRIALITSAESAAVRDMLQVVTRRWRSADIVVVPVPVQGETAAPRIAAALRSVHRIPNVDVVIAGRGGGSLEDLWAFNEESVARAIAACEVPVISAVGHEIDVTIADLVADRRALTPSEAGELVVPLAAEVRQEVNRLHQRLTMSLRQRAANARWQLDALAARPALARPLSRIHELSQRLDELAARLPRGLTLRLDRARQQLGAVSGKLNVLSPLHVLDRGYSITRKSASGEIVRSTAQVAPGEHLTTVVAEGQIESIVQVARPSRPGV